jgi:DNA-directed RNA polymerase specialized sigma subunit
MTKKKVVAPATQKPKKPKNYLNKRDMLAALQKCHDADAMTPEFARMITLLADRYGSRFEYADYAPHIDDMKAVAVMNIVRAWRSFDLEKYDNPFAYFTQAIKHTFWQYVHQEKKHRLNRDHLLIENGELPSDAFVDDIAKAITKELMDEAMDDMDVEETPEEIYKKAFNKRKFDILPEDQKPGEIVTVNIDDYLKALEDQDENDSPAHGMHGDVQELKRNDE